MKFWQKAFFCVIVVFLLGFDIMGYILAERSFILNRDYALSAAEDEQRVILRSVYESIWLSENYFSEINTDNLTVTMTPYSDFYLSQGIYFRLYLDGVQAFDNLPAAYTDETVETGVQHAEMKEIDGKLYCFIASYLDDPYSNLLFIYIKDMQPLVHFRSQIIQTFTVISIIVSLILAVVMLFLLIGLTGPLRRLSATAAEISKGRYNMRTDIKTNDEIGDFAQSFNLMADHIEKHITELSRMTDEKQSLIDNLSHELRTPATAIIGYGELLKIANCNDIEREKAVGHIINQGRRIQGMANTLLSLRDSNIEMLPVELSDMLYDTVAALDHQIREKKLDIRIDAQPVNVTGDVELIKSLLINLLDNSIKASDTNGVIELHMNMESNGVSVSVSDYGRGIPEDEIPNVTEAFYRVEKSRSRREGGAGLGLALCSRICELHNATLNIASTSGKGTTVKITFTTL